MANERDESLSTALNPISRKIIPRWRRSAIAATTGELEPLNGLRERRYSGTDELDARIDDWRRGRTEAFASDLASAGLVLDATNDSDVMDAAKHILTLGSAVPAPLRGVALAIEAANEGTQSTFAHPDDGEGLEMESRRHIHEMKMRLSSHPRNAVLWVDMARQYAMLGANRHAVRSMRNGLAMAQNNRFVLRSAARLFVHLGDHEQAYDILRKSPATRRDPWLRAAEIAVAGLNNKTPVQLGRTKKELNSTNLDLGHISELASAVATFELNVGSTKSARRLFNLGLEKPTENAVAQAKWAANHVGGISLNEEHLLLPRAFEAKAAGHFDKQELNECLFECSQWLEDEPFSSRPMELSSFISIVALEDYVSAISQATRGLMSNPDNFLLRNNLSVAQAESGKLEDAEVTFRAIKFSGLSVSEQTCWLATNGMLTFREGSYDEGRGSYRRAVDLAKLHANKELEAMALIHWAYEESKAGWIQTSYGIARQAESAVCGLSSTAVQLALSRFKSHSMGNEDWQAPPCVSR